MDILTASVCWIAILDGHPGIHVSDAVKFPSYKTCVEAAWYQKQFEEWLLFKLPHEKWQQQLIRTWIEDNARRRDAWEELRYIQATYDSPYTVKGLHKLKKMLGDGLYMDRRMMDPVPQWFMEICGKAPKFSDIPQMDYVGD